MPAAKYLVTTDAIHVPPLGFMAQGMKFEAPPGFIPSVTLRCLNEEASTALDAAIGARDALLVERLAESVGIADRTKVQAELDALRAGKAEAIRVLSFAEASDLASQFAGLASVSMVTGRAAQL